MSIIHDVKQGSDEWHRLRIGIPTASRFDDLITPTGKPRETITRNKYLAELVAERILQQPLDGDYQSGWMRRGLELEAQAVDVFKRLQNCELDGGGFITTHDGKIGCSPDSVIRPIAGTNAKIGVEIKVPSPQIHTYYFLYGLGDAYKAQVQGQMHIGGFDMLHLFSWNPGLPHVHIITARNEIFIARLSGVLQQFCEELDEATARARAAIANGYSAAPLEHVSSPNVIPGVFPWR